MDKEEILFLFNTAQPLTKYVVAIKAMPHRTERVVEVEEVGGIDGHVNVNLIDGII
jgi:hypothetical protein